MSRCNVNNQNWLLNQLRQRCCTPCSFERACLQNLWLNTCFIGVRAKIPLWHHACSKWQTKTGWFFRGNNYDVYVGNQYNRYKLLVATLLSLQSCWHHLVHFRGAVVRSPGAMNWVQPWGTVVSIPSRSFTTPSGRKTGTWRIKNLMYVLLMFTSRTTPARNRWSNWSFLRLKAKRSLKSRRLILRRDSGFGGRPRPCGGGDRLDLNRPPLWVTDRNRSLERPQKSQSGWHHLARMTKGHASPHDARTPTRMHLPVWLVAQRSHFRSPLTTRSWSPPWKCSGSANKWKTWNWKPCSTSWPPRPHWALFWTASKEVLSPYQELLGLVKAL